MHSPSPSSVLTDLLAAVRSTRQNHAWEHATLHVLGGRGQVRQASGLSDPSGFTLFGEMSVEDVDQAVADAQAAIDEGRRGLAIHPDCGTNLVVQALLSVLVMQILGRAGRGFSVARFTAGLLSMTALSMAAKVLGPRLQTVTTLADLRDREVTEVYALRVFGKPAVRVSVGARM
ncbi:MAG: hypothetical protein J4G06_04635 [Caldilineaceae bacterium]|nr:hypothetical protein [Caldilineaceae bacterium]